MSHEELNDVIRANKETPFIFKSLLRYFKEDSKSVLKHCIFFIKILSTIVTKIKY